MLCSTECSRLEKLQLIFDLTYKNNEISREADTGYRGALIPLWDPAPVLLFGRGVENWLKPPWSPGERFCSLLCPWTRSQPGSPAKSSTSQGPHCTAAAQHGMTTKADLVWALRGGAWLWAASPTVNASTPWEGKPEGMWYFVSRDIFRSTLFTINLLCKALSFPNRRKKPRIHPCYHVFFGRRPFPWPIRQHRL